MCSCTSFWKCLSVFCTVTCSIYSKFKKTMFTIIHTITPTLAPPSTSPVGFCSLDGSDGMCSQSGKRYSIDLVSDKHRKHVFIMRNLRCRKRSKQDVLSLFKRNDRTFLSPDPFQKYPGSQAEPGSSITTILNTNT